MLRSRYKIANVETKSQRGSPLKHCLNLPRRVEENFKSSGCISQELTGQCSVCFILSHMLWLKRGQVNYIGEDVNISRLNSKCIAGWKPKHIKIYGMRKRATEKEGKINMFRKCLNLLLSILWTQSTSLARPSHELCGHFTILQLHWKCHPAEFIYCYFDDFLLMKWIPDHQGSGITYVNFRNLFCTCRRPTSLV